MALISIENIPKFKTNKCLGCTWKKVDACDLKQYDRERCPMEQKVTGIESRKMGRTMTSFNDLNFLKSYLLNAKANTGKIPDDIMKLQGVEPIPKSCAIEATVWLLSKTPHSVEEVADHFGMSIELAEHIIQDLLKNDMVIQVIGSPVRYKRET